MSNQRTQIGASVKAFYNVLPFNFSNSVQLQSKLIRDQNVIEYYHILPNQLKKGLSILEVGCGTGLYTNSIAHYYPKSAVHGIDFCKTAIGRAKKVANELNVSPTFELTDLFDYHPESRFDLVISIGVLHHTGDFKGAINKIAKDFLRENGQIYLGLYHKHGRKPFLEFFDKLKSESSDETSLHKKFIELYSVNQDQKYSLSWFRDQVIHPHETQHTLSEINNIANELGKQITLTSLNEFQPFDQNSLHTIIESEFEQEIIGRRELAKGNFYPGFFTVLIQ